MSGNQQSEQGDGAASSHPVDPGQESPSGQQQGARTVPADEQGTGLDEEDITQSPSRNSTLPKDNDAEINP